VWANYQAGPGGSFSLGEFFSSLFSLNVSFQSSGGLNDS
jgi:hypothetical protein